MDASDVPLISVPLAARAPTLDGVVGASEWSHGCTPTAFMVLGEGTVALEQPRVWVQRDSEALYIAAELPLPRDSRPLAAAATRDGAVWSDDAIEVFLDPTHSHSEYYHFIVNSAGVQYEARGRVSGWDAEWEARTRVGGEGWAVEARIPFAALGVSAPRPGEVWGLNVCWDRQTPSRMLATWAHVQSSFHEPGWFGHLYFLDDAPAVEVVGPGSLVSGEVAFTGRWRASRPAEAMLIMEREEAKGPEQLGSARATQPGGNQEQRFALSAELPMEGRFLRAGRYRIQLTVTGDERVLYRALAAMRVAPPLQVAVRQYFTEGKVEVDVDGTGLRGAAGAVKLSVLLRSAEGVPLQEVLVRNGPDPLVGMASLDIRGRVPGTYEVLVTATDAQGEELWSVSKLFTKPSTPHWYGSMAGVSDEVLPPWTAVRAEGNEVQVWGRSYGFEALPFPNSVITAGSSLLAGPITLRLVIDGQEQTWEAAGAPHVLEAKPCRLVLGTEAAARLATCIGRVATEFDGMVRSDFTLTPTGAQHINELALLIPLKEQHARYFYHFPGEWGRARNVGALPPEGLTLPFRPFVWLGDEDRGFAWFTETDELFTVADPGKVTQITRENGVVTLRVNIINTPRPAAPLRFTFGFQATPVKPLTPDVWDYRICHHGNYGIEDQPWQEPSTITYPAEGNIGLEQGTFEAWVRPQFNTKPDVRPDDPGRGIYNRMLFSVEFATDALICFYWNVDDRGMRLYYRQGHQYPLLISTHSDWQPGEWHHVAFTWGDRTRVFVDGQKLAEREYQGTLAVPLRGARIVLGGSPCDFEVDELRISGVPREHFDLAQAPSPDEHTLLLEHYDQALPEGGPRTTAPERGQAGVAVGGTVGPGRFGNALALRGPDKPTTILDRLAELGVRTIVFHEHWTDIQNYPSTTHGEALHKLVKACHERGLKLLLYFGYLMADIAPEWEAWSDEVLVMPRQGDYKRSPAQTDYAVCYRSVWQDFLAEGIAKLIDEYDIDGVYLDGTEYPWACTNTHHGCGYRRADGTIAPTYGIFAARDMVRRIYTIIRSRKPDGQINIHNSTVMTIPTLSWATSTWDGEQFGGLERSPENLAILPLDAFRAEFMGRQWGVPAEFLCYNRPWTMREALSFTLLHDVLVRGSLGGSLEMESQLWKGMEAFGRRKAVWLPYWANAQYIAVGPNEAIKASLYSRAERGVVVVISNLGESEQTATAQLNREALSLPRELEATDMLTGAAVSMTPEGGLAFTLKPFEFRVVWVKPPA